MESSSKVRGKIKGLHEDYDDKGQVGIDVELPPKHEPAPKGKKGKSKKGDAMTEGPMPYRPSTRVCIPKEHAADFAIGDPVEIETTVRHYGKRTDGKKE